MRKNKVCMLYTFLDTNVLSFVTITMMGRTIEQSVMTRTCMLGG